MVNAATMSSIRRTTAGTGPAPLPRYRPTLGHSPRQILTGEMTRTMSAKRSSAVSNSPANTRARIPPTDRHRRSPPPCSSSRRPRAMVSATSPCGRSARGAARAREHRPLDRAVVRAAASGQHRLGQRDRLRQLVFESRQADATPSTSQPQSRMVIQLAAPARAPHWRPRRHPSPSAGSRSRRHPSGPARPRSCRLDQTRWNPVGFGGIALPQQRSSQRFTGDKSTAATDRGTRKTFTQRTERDIVRRRSSS